MQYPFRVNEQYSRQDVYELLGVPDEQRRGNWETGYNQWGDDLFIFCNVGAAGRSGHDYDNRWLDDGRFQWFAKERTHVDQPQMRRMLNPPGNVLLFTRQDNRDPFVFRGYAEPGNHEATTPVKIIWRVQGEPTAVPPSNIALANRAELEGRHYVRKADPAANYWFDFAKNRLDSYRSRWTDNFEVILAGDRNVVGDYYRVPYHAISHLLTDAHLAGDGSGRARWIGHVRQHRLQITRCPIKLDIAEYYGLPLDGGAVLPESVENDYAIENRKAEVKQRVKQSVFRRRVLDNFGSKCCLSGISEPELLVASHIVPWAARIDCRLDPANGLCLSVLYDALFDCGLFTISEDLRVVVARGEFSEPLKSLLAPIEGKQLCSPRTPIKAEFLAYHREQVFRG